MKARQAVEGEQQQHTALCSTEGISTTSPWLSTRQPIIPHPACSKKTRTAG